MVSSLASENATMRSPIRPLEQEDIPAVARLYQVVMRGGSDEPPAFLEPFFERTLLDQPWADSTIPSLVYVEEGEIVGFIGSNVRRMRFDGQPVTMACSAHQIAHPRVRKRAVGALLMRKYMSGPQDLTITDGATEPVRRMWEGLGGRTVHACCFSYVYVFRPWRLVLGRVAERFGVHRVEPVVAPLAAGLDRATAAVWPGLRRAAPATDVEPLTPQLLLELLPVIDKTVRLRVEYDLPYLGWLFQELDREQPTLWERGVRRGKLWAEAVHRGGRPVGWYVCQLRAGLPCRVLQIAATSTETDFVLTQLLHRASARGATGVYGRVEPRLVGPLSVGRSSLRFSEGRMLVSARDPELVNAVVRGDALLTRLDGEWW
jgi:hypothetical protein